MQEKFDVEKDPDCCPTCRHIHRTMFSPRLQMHHRTSDLSGDPILSIFHPRNTFPVYAVKEWWSDGWDELSFGKPIDFSKPFFPQFLSLYAEVPKMANQNQNTENCEYAYACGNARNVYYSRTVYRSEDVYYSQYVTGYNRSICDCLHCYRSSHLYECVQCLSCTSSSYLLRCSNSGDCHFSIDLSGCTDCLFCSNLRNKTYHVENKPVSPEEYRRIRASVLDGKFSTLKKNLRRYADVYVRTVWKNLTNVNTDDCVGDGLTNCSHCYHCFQSINVQDARYCRRLSPSERCVTAMDISSGGIGELLYNSVALGGGNYRMRMCLQCRLCSDLTYCSDSYSSKNCFGCAGLRSKQYCIFNKQYSKEEYERILLKIIERMRNTGEWGVFFPLDMSPFAYNESDNMDEHPLPKEEILRRGWRWEETSEEIPTVDRSSIPATKLPDAIDQAPDDVLQWALQCTESKRPFRVIQSELQFYREMHLPLPRIHPALRMTRRLRMLNPHQLWERTCGKCGKAMQSSYHPLRPEIVYCEECYLAAVY